ncbi:rhodanese-like domain-containing protein [Rubritalea profundi]|uniref:Rhodanese domain-containing protein n=1 Tax=Rubritalea profundi TaxID=1658618 RepID=A0A2S7TZ68_9BACT|nr:rhodanese-like domain-containing protein [Rubritalea profundi]PQJ28039.1 hypothetical protein BSZ32_05675 [Rubritalea profundi]
MTTIPVKEYLADRNAFYLVDVRTASEFSEAHIEGAHLHPLDSLNVAKLGFQAQGKKLLVSCLSGARAQKAAKQIAASGHEVACLEGSLHGWEKDGQPVVRSTPSGLPLIRQVHLTVSIINMTAALLALLINPAWAWVIVGTSAGLFLAGATGFCGMGLLLAKMPWNQTSPKSDDCEEG